MTVVTKHRMEVFLSVPRSRHILFRKSDFYPPIVTSISIIGKFYDTSVPGPVSPCFPGRQCTSDQAFHQTKSQLRSPAHLERPAHLGRPAHLERPAHFGRSAKFSYKKSSSKDPCINTFVSTFVEEVQYSQALSELFGFFSHTSAMEFCNGKYPEILEAMIDYGAPNPEFVSQQAVEGISESFDTLTSDIVIQVYANTIAKYLFTQGVLTPQNAVQLGKQYADTMEEAASSSDSQYKALKDGFVNFLDSLGLFTSDKGLLIALQYANEWKLAARPRRG
ncbi:hypothetical protein AVEN_104476-1 [Araneus ventricosus]|uniref:Uncharacterized protein n=1 Tax=Araneus ventricosus TaxID=182803 RepID=A0A4Y2TNH1_ARAVE|nr:hypothetical protein AVEN_104476-1 [Araneus ventricosus]